MYLHERIAYGHFLVKVQRCNLGRSLGRMGAKLRPSKAEGSVGRRLVEEMAKQKQRFIKASANLGLGNRVTRSEEAGQYELGQNFGRPSANLAGSQARRAATDAMLFLERENLGTTSVPDGLAEASDLRGTGKGESRPKIGVFGLLLEMGTHCNAVLFAAPARCQRVKHDSGLASLPSKEH